VGTFGAMGIRVKSNHYSFIVTTWHSLYFGSVQGFESPAFKGSNLQRLMVTYQTFSH
jgi:hypothetical protein